MGISQGAPKSALASSHRRIIRAGRLLIYRRGKIHFSLVIRNVFAPSANSAFRFHGRGSYVDKPKVARNRFILLAL